MSRDYAFNPKKATEIAEGPLDKAAPNRLASTGRYSVLHWHRQKGWETHSVHPSMDVANTHATKLIDERYGGKVSEYGRSAGPSGSTIDYDMRDKAGRSLAAVRVMKTEHADNFLNDIERHYPGIVKNKSWE